ncbi:MAG: DNA starvation/stationary phase protection protein [Clostridia bacterium]|nr:DNA starvation/stationary phase protection protein [Clostridia bacterium]
MNLEQILNELLADLNVFYRKLQNYHWNVEGRDFFIAHTKLEELYDEINKSIDEIAEHILILGGQPLGTLKDYLEISTIKEAENKKVKSDEVYSNLITDFELLLKKSVEIKEEADKENEYSTSSLIDEYILQYGKYIWMLKHTMA